jgi:cell volume regulation protein A
VCGQEAKDDLASGSYDLAVKQLERVEGRAAGTLLAQQAMLDLAYAKWRLNERVEATLEIESGMNDPMAVFLTLALVGVVLGASASAAAPPSGWQLAGHWAEALLMQLGLGLLLGVAAGFGLAALLNWLRATAHPAAGVVGLVLLAAGLLLFAACGWLGGSGFLAVYVAGVLVGNRARKAVLPAMSIMDGYAWLAQASMFLLLGLLATPSEVLRTLWPALGVSAVLMLVARPLSVWLCLAPLHFARHEMAFISWVGLRGAVPIVLAVFPLMAGLPTPTLLHDKLVYSW